MTTAMMPTIGNRTRSRTTAEDRADTAAATAEIDYLGIYARSIFAMTVVFLIGVGVPVSIFLDNFVHGFGLGAMCAVWGGPSFGVMAGSAGVSTQLERLEKAQGPH